MSLTLNTNVAALNAHYQLSSNDGMLSKVINRLSSGLRINSAADDPSGLSISQRLTTQIKGLSRASMNAQDAISFLQTAEGALTETQNILQRMRELAIQAANGTLTSSDRQEIQKEIDQLKEEVDSIAKSSEFNTKKLLDGSASALWSASSDKTNVIVKGKVREGNYQLEVETTPVDNHVLKSDIFKVKAAVQGVESVDLYPADAAQSFTFDGATNANSGTLTFDFGSGSVYSLAVSATETAAQLAAAINSDSTLNQYLIATTQVVGANTVLTMTSRAHGADGNAYSVQADAANVGGFPTATEYTFAGGVDFPSGITSVSNPQSLPESTTVTGIYTVYADNVVAPDAAGDTAHAISAYEQPVGGVITSASTAAGLSGHVNAVAGNTTAQTGSGYAILEILTGGTADGAGAGEILGRVSFDEGKTWYNTGNLDTGAAVTLTDGTSSFQLTALIAGNIINTGDKLLVALNDRDFNGTSHAEAQVDSPFTNGMGGTAQSGPIWSFTTDSLNNRTTTINVGYLNSHTGDVTFGTVDMAVDTLASAGAANTSVRAENNRASFDVTASGGPAFGATKLWQIDKFYDNSGNFILGENGKEVTIYNGIGDKTTIHLDPEDTIEGVADKIADAIAKTKENGGLGMSTGDNTIDGHIADFVTTATNLSDEAVRGTIVIRSPWMGERGKLFFSAEENILNALSLATINDPRQDPMTITVTDAHTGALIGQETVADSTLHNVIQGVEIELDPNMDTTIAWDAGTRKFTFTSQTGTDIEMVHIVDNSQSFQVGAYAGQVIESNIAEMTTDALKINRVVIVDAELAKKSLTVLSDAIDKVSSERARIGALMNRMEHTINNLGMQEQSATAANSRIKDLDYAQESTELSRFQMITQAAQAMLAQANKLPESLLQLLR